MKVCAKEILSIARDLLPDVEFLFKGDSSTLDELFKIINKYLYRIQHNEGFESTLSRYDEDGEMVVAIGIGDHPQKVAIIRELKKYVMGIALKLNVRFE
jgi:hypothetical protein